MTSVCTPSLSKTPSSFDPCTAGRTVTVGLCMSFSSLIREAGLVHDSPLPTCGVRGTWPGGSAPTASEPRAAGVCWLLSALLVCFYGGVSAAFINIVFLFSLSLVISLTFPHLPCDNSRGG